jgi:eukaryotic-like serine/threonine-protein kinase
MSTGRHLPMSFTPDGRNLVFVDQQLSEMDLSVLTLSGPREARPLTGLNTPADEASADISPDGRWIAYQSNEDGEFKIYVRPFPEVGRARYVVSPQGGVNPAWSRDGSELFYIAPSGGARIGGPVSRVDGMLTAVRVITTGATFRFETGVPLFNVSRYVNAAWSRSYDVSRDGKRFLFLRLQTLSPPPDLVVVVNWIEELKARTRQH